MASASPLTQTARPRENAGNAAFFALVLGGALLVWTLVGAAAMASRSHDHAGGHAHVHAHEHAVGHGQAPGHAHGHRHAHKSEASTAAGDRIAHRDRHAAPLDETGHSHDGSVPRWHAWAHTQGLAHRHVDLDAAHHHGAAGHHHHDGRSLFDHSHDDDHAPPSSSIAAVLAGELAVVAGALAPLGPPALQPGEVALASHRLLAPVQRARPPPLNRFCARDQRIRI